MRILKRLLLGAALVLAAGQPLTASASPLNLTLLQSPDIFSSQIDLTYDAASGLLSANGFSLQFTYGAGQTADIENGTFNIDIQTDGMATTGDGLGTDLVVTGDVTTDLGTFSGTLLTGKIARFGANDAGPGIFEYVFEVTGGELVPDYFSDEVGVILGAGSNSTYTGSFAVDFSNLDGGAGTGTGSSDTAPIPEPGTLLLIGAGVAGLAGFGRRERGAL